MQLILHAITSTWQQGNDNTQCVNNSNDDNRLLTWHVVESKVRANGFCVAKLFLPLFKDFGRRSRVQRCRILCTGLVLPMKRYQGQSQFERSWLLGWLYSRYRLMFIFYINGHMKSRWDMIKSSTHIISCYASGMEVLLQYWHGTLIICKSYMYMVMIRLSGGGLLVQISL